MGKLLTTSSEIHFDKLISIVAPVFNESEVISIFHQTLTNVLKMNQYRFEILYVDDGSQDDSYQILKSIQNHEPNVSVIKLSRNFGKELAVTAGLEKVKGDAVIVMDCDLQDPPNNIPLMVDTWLSGADIVNMRRISRKGDSFIKKQTAKYFYKLMKAISHIEIEENVGDFRLLSRKVVNAINEMPERNRFMKGIFSWVGYQKVTMDYVRMPRHAGKTKWPYWKLWNFALDGLTSFSTTPLKISSYIGFLFAFGSFCVGLFFLFKTMAYGDDVKGFPTLFLTILFMGGIQLISVGVIGEYISRIFIEVKGRPHYLVDEYLNHDQAKPKVKNKSAVNSTAEQVMNERFQEVY
jgi:glycosyltransferase involved in cell wall biosynthesis